MFSCKNNLQFLAPLMGFTLTGQSNQHRSFSTNYLQFMDSLCATCIFVPANKHPTSYEDIFRHTVSEAAKTWCEFFVFPTIVCADCETAIHNALTTVWPGLEAKTCRFHLGQSWWRKYNIWDSASSMERKILRLSQFSKKIFGLSLLPSTEVCDCFALEFLSNLPNDKRVEQFCDYLLENCIDADSTFPLPVWSECTA